MGSAPAPLWRCTLDLLRPYEDVITSLAGRRMIDIVQALEDPNLFGPWFAGPSWMTWKAVLKGAFAIPMGPDELSLFRAVAPKRRVRELWAVAALPRCQGSAGAAPRPPCQP